MYALNTALQMQYIAPANQLKQLLYISENLSVICKKSNTEFEKRYNLLKTVNYFYNQYSFTELKTISKFMQEKSIKSGSSF